MGLFHFGLGWGRVSTSTARKVARIARKHDATFEYGKMPEGHRFWFSCANMGAPFDEQTAHAVMDALEKAGLWPIPLPREGEK